MTEPMEVNRAHWNEVAAIHAASTFYDLAGIRAGRDTLREWEPAEVGDVSGKRLLHLQCHIGTDTVSWARRGAVATGVDFAEEALAIARRLASECGVDITFVQSNVYDVPSVLEGPFDVVYTSRGVLGWLPDLTRWAAVVAGLLKPGGVFYLEEYHPFGWLFDEKKDVVALAYDYFAKDPIMDEDDGTYADLQATVVNRRTYGWNYGIAEVITALLDAGMRLDLLRERPGCGSQILPYLVQDPGKSYRWFTMPPDRPQVPLSFSLRATRQDIAVTPRAHPPTGPGK